jgi:hypothetical protein
VFQQKGSDPQSNNSSAVTWVKDLGINVGGGLKFQSTAPGRHPRRLVVRSAANQ